MLRWNAFPAGVLLALGMIVGCQQQKKTTAESTAPEQPVAAVPEATAPVAETPAPAPASAPETAPPPAPLPEHAAPIAGSQAPLPRESYTPRKPARPRTHVVKSGETLQSIAKKYYNDPRKWRRIYEYNRQRIKDPDKISVGMKLIIP